MKVVIIPARGGSSRVKSKNIKKFFNKPIIRLTYDIIKKANIFDKIVLTSDSEKVINKCENFGFDEIIKRPQKLGYDDVGIEEVINHSIEVLDKKFVIKSICCIFPCSPLLKKKTIIKAYSMLRNKKDFIFTVTSYPAPIEKAMKIKNNKLTPMFPRMLKYHSKDFENQYFDIGQLYLGTKESWKIKKKTLKGIVLPKYSSVDINDQKDWDFAKILYKKMKT